MKRVHVAAAAFLCIVAVRSASAQAIADRHHYSISARVRPLVVFWISKSGVGDAFVSRQIGASEAQYSLLIGSDPERTPLHVNRWGYIKEDIRNGSSRMIGVMTESDEESLEEAEAHVRDSQAAHHPFKLIEGSADAFESRSRVRSIDAPQDYTLRHLSAVLDLADRDDSEGRSRTVRVPAGARTGFLSALADAMRDSSTAPIRYVYFGRVYELKRARTERLPDARIGQRSYGPAIAAEFINTSLHDGEQTRFSITYATEGPLAGVPLRVRYQPRWWMQIELTIADGEAS